MVKTKTSPKQKFALMAAGIVCFLFLLEIGLRCGGVVSVYLQERRNQKGMKRSGAYRIVCLGESTTALGGDTSYPSQLEKILNQKCPRQAFSVINKGVVAVGTASIMARLDENLRTYKPDMVVAMMGINDGPGLCSFRVNFEQNSFLGRLRIYKLGRLLWSVLLHQFYSRGFLSEGNCPRQSMDDAQVQGVPGAATEDPDINSSLDAAREYRQQGDFSRAFDSFFKALEAEPDNDRIYLELGWLYVMQGNHARAQEMFTRAVELNPGNNEAYIALGLSYLKEAHYERAIAAFEQAIAIDPRTEQPYGGLAACYEQSGDAGKAQEYRQKAGALREQYYNPVTCSHYRELARVLREKNIPLVIVQYPLRNVAALRKMFPERDNIIFVDNETVFKNAVKRDGYAAYFTDSFAGDFGHCTALGNRLLAENIARVIFDEVCNAGSR